MKISNLLICTCLALSLNNLAYAAEHLKAESAIKSCPILPMTAAYVTHDENNAKDTDLGKAYEGYLNKVKTLLEAENVKNFKIIQQDFYVHPTLKSDGSKDTTLILVIDLDVDSNYKAITALKTLQNTEVNVSTYERQRCL